MERDNIIKALECCVTVEFGGDCPFDCPYAYNDDCEKLIFNNALSLIKELTEENEAWQKQLIATEEKSEKAYYDLACEVEDLRTENESLHASRTELTRVQEENERLKQKRMNKIDIYKALDILDKFDFFQGQRAGRELWSEKPFEVQEEDLKKFSMDVELLKDFVEDIAHKLKCAELQIEAKERICESYMLQYGTAADKEVWLKKERADTVRKMQERLKEYFPYDADSGLYVVLDQIAKEMLED